MFVEMRMKILMKTQAGYQVSRDGILLLVVMLMVSSFKEMVRRMCSWYNTHLPKGEEEDSGPPSTFSTFIFLGFNRNGEEGVVMDEHPSPKM